MKKRMCLALCLILLGSGSVSSRADAPIEAKQWLKDAGAVQFSHQENASGILKDVYLGYNEAGDLVVGVAGRRIKTYEKVDIYVAVALDDTGSRIVGVAVPLLDDKIAAGKKRDNVNSALRDIDGAVLTGPDGKFKKIDAVTGATRYHKVIYTGYDRLADELVDLMKENPDWAKQDF